MYSWGSVVGKASTIDPEISPTPPLTFTGGGQNVLNLALLSAVSRPRLKMQQGIILNSEQKSATQRWPLYVLAKSDETESTHPWEPPVRRPPPLKLHGKNVLKRQ